MRASIAAGRRRVTATCGLVLSLMPWTGMAAAHGRSSGTF
jgi:hypothetical protein